MVFGWILVDFVEKCGSRRGLPPRAHYFRAEQQDTAARWADWCIFNGFWWHIAGFLMAFDAFSYCFDGF